MVLPSERLREFCKGTSTVTKYDKQFGRCVVDNTIMATTANVACGREPSTDNRHLLITLDQRPALCTAQWVCRRQFARHK